MKVKAIPSLFILLSVVFSLFPEKNFSQQYALRFYGHGVDAIDRVIIPLDNPNRKLDAGGDFTIEFRMKALLADNPGGGSAVQGANDDWTLGHVMIDRDIFGPGDHGDYGISLAGGRIAFGVNNGTSSYTLIGTDMVADGQWHHIAVTRSGTTGAMRIWVDGNTDNMISSTNITGDVSYRDGREITANGIWIYEPYLVLGAEKHDYDNTVYPSYNGLMDELRISSVIRYNSAFTPQNRFTDDAATLALYHFDEGSGTTLSDASVIAGPATDGTLLFGGSNPAGPVWVPTALTWTGAVSNSWTDPDNWSPPLVPAVDMDVIIAPGFFQPVVDQPQSDPAVCGSLQLLPGTQLLINPGKVLSVNGELVIH